MQAIVSRLGISVVAALGVVAVAGTCRAADTSVALDLDYVRPLSVKGANSGAGVMLRLGRELGVGPGMLRGEVGLSYDTFGGDLEPRLYRGVVGLRAGFGAILRPSVFAHVGFGRASYDDVLAPGLSHDALTYDAGAALDFVLLPLLNVGAHAAYNQLLASDKIESVKWLTLGVHAELVF